MVKPIGREAGGEIKNLAPPRLPSLRRWTVERLVMKVVIEFIDGEINKRQRFFVFSDYLKWKSLVIGGHGIKDADELVLVYRERIKKEKK